MKRLVIGVCGGTSSGKTTLAKKIWANMIELGHNAIILSQDSFYKNLSPEELEAAKKNEYNFDHPNSIDFTSMREVLGEMIEGTELIKIPIYDFCTHQRLPKYHVVEPTDIIIVEGIFIFTDPELVDLMDIKLFVDVDSDTRLVRRIRRDLADRGRDINQVLESYERFVKPGFVSFILPFKREADLIIPNGGNNQIAIDLICQLLKNKSNSKDGIRSMPEGYKAGEPGYKDCCNSSLCSLGSECNASIERLVECGIIQKI